jgi:peptidoglycan/LPS O-acetylase OafA/YrhL
MRTKTFFVLLVTGIVTLSLGAWMYYSKKGSLELVDLLQYVIIFVLVAFALMIGIRRLKSERRGEPAEDELSKKIMQRAAATAYYVSLYWWLVLVYLSDNWQKETESLIGTGILGMAILFALCWVYYKIKGVKS